MPSHSHNYSKTPRDARFSPLIGILLVALHATCGHATTLGRNRHVVGRPGQFEMLSRRAIRKPARLHMKGLDKGSRRVSASACDPQHKTPDLMQRRRETMLWLAGALMKLSAVPAATMAFELPGTNNTCNTLEAKGMQVCELKQGNGPEPVEDDIVKCNYEIKLVDSNKVVVNARNYLFQLGIGEVIAGWELLILGDPSGKLEAMQVGSVRRAIIPASLAYGDGKRGCNADGCAIPPNSKVAFISLYSLFCIVYDKFGSFISSLSLQWSLLGLKE